MAPRNDNYLSEVVSVCARAGTIPAHRAAFRNGYSFSTRSFEEQLSIWNNIWQISPGIYPRIHAFFFLEKHVAKQENHKAIWETSLSWQNDVDDWPLCDSLSKLNTKVLETFPADVYQQLAAWNKDNDLWKRRQSVVSLLYYSRTKSGFLPFTKIRALVHPLLKDNEYYVQKGVGWTLRELNNVYPEQTQAYAEKHIGDISPIAFTTTIEKMDTPVKDRLKALRKQAH